MAGLARSSGEDGVMLDSENMSKHRYQKKETNSSHGGVSDRTLKSYYTFDGLGFYSAMFQDPKNTGRTSYELLACSLLTLLGPLLWSQR